MCYFSSKLQIVDTRALKLSRQGSSKDSSQFMVLIQNVEKEYPQIVTVITLCLGL